MAGKMTEEIVRCSFCNKTQAQVRKLIAGPNGTYICDQCVGICSEIIEEELDYNDRGALDDINLLTPEEMKAFLDQYVIGQDSDAGTDRMWKDASGTDTGKNSECSVCDR